MWPHIDRVALLGLSGTDAVVRASELAAGGSRHLTLAIRPKVSGGEE